jgi:hypothetical protein
MEDKTIKLVLFRIKLMILYLFMCVCVCMCVCVSVCVYMCVCVWYNMQLVFKNVEFTSLNYTFENNVGSLSLKENF